MQPHPLDLFGEVVVTHDDVRAWLRAVPRIDPDGPRAAHYIRGYGVAAKVAAAKRSGSFDALVTPRPMAHQSAAWWDRMLWT